MGFNCGIVGLPNVGKSTLFNALTQTAAAESANYPFCTIEPNIGRVAVPDVRLAMLADIAQSQSIIPTQLEFVDIAGLVKGASKGEGLGNQFLGNIRDVDAIVHVLRCFEDDNITHVEGKVNPIRDAEIIETELVLSDLESLEKRLPPLEKKAKGGDKEAKANVLLMQRILSVLAEGNPARMVVLEPEETRRFSLLQLITAKPIMYVCNVSEDDVEHGNAWSNTIGEKAKKEHAVMVCISAQIESDIAALDDEQEKSDFLSTLGLKEPGLNRVIRAGYSLLDLITFFTVGPKETHAWTVRKGASAPEAAGVIHTDFQKGFIRAETISCEDFVACKGDQGAKDSGKMRLEGKDYIIHDGDVLHFRFNV